MNILDPGQKLVYSGLATPKAPLIIYLIEWIEWGVYEA